MTFSREPRVLLCIADPVYRTVVLRRFEYEGWECEESSRAEDAERRAVRFCPQIIIVDMVSLHDAKALLARWKSLPTLLQTRVIVDAEVLAHGEADSLLRAGAATVFLRGYHTPEEIVRRAAKELPSAYLSRSSS